jgi:hypothetical protein
MWLQVVANITEFATNVMIAGSVGQPAGARKAAGLLEVAPYSTRKARRLNPDRVGQRRLAFGIELLNGRRLMIAGFRDLD